MIRVNMKQFRKLDLNKINQDNIRLESNFLRNIRVHNSIATTKGIILSLNQKDYIDFLNEFNIFYTIS